MTTPQHLAPHIENLGSTIKEFHTHVESKPGHHHATRGVLHGINNAALHFLQLAAHVRKGFPEADRKAFYTDLNNEVQAAEKAAATFNELHAHLSENGVNGAQVEAALLGQQIAIEALFNNLKAADPNFEADAGHIQKSLDATVQGAIDTYAK